MNGHGFWAFWADFWASMVPWVGPTIVVLLVALLIISAIAALDGGITKSWDGDGWYWWVLGVLIALLNVAVGIPLVLYMAGAKFA